MFDHVTLGVSDIAVARRLYDAVMQALGIGLSWETARMLAYSNGSEVEFGLQFDPGAARQGTHVAFLAVDRAAVRRFHAAGLEFGGRDAGAPGVRPEYHAHYFAAFLLDPDGNRLEAVCHRPA